MNFIFRLNGDVSIDKLNFPFLFSNKMKAIFSELVYCYVIVH